MRSTTEYRTAPMKQKRLAAKYAFLFWFGGSTYVAFEVLFRGCSHWTMLLLGGMLFVLLGLLNEVMPWEVGLLWQVAIGTALVTAMEFAVGCIVNLWLGWNIWDYSSLPGNVLGQISPQYTAMWVPLTLLAIVTDDLIRWRFFGEQRPAYTLL
ncbi:MAG: hypothetical protein AB7C89_04950 [Intestinibacillus sp.]